MRNVGDVLRAHLLDSERAIPTSRLSRLFRTGRAASALASSLLSLRVGSDEAVDELDLQEIARAVSRIGELKGVAMKAGQMLGYVDPTLPPEVRELLSVLQTASPASPFSAVEAELRRALGPRAEELLASIDRRPLAVASIGQVHRARASGVDVAVKVRHAGIVEAIGGDFTMAGLGPVFARALGPTAGASAKGFIEEARIAMLEETDLALEAKRQACFGEWLAAHERLVVPEVLPRFCASSVLTTRFVEGLSLDQLVASPPPRDTLDRIGVALFELYMGTLYRHGAFHADPHPGNYAFLEGGRVVVYDFGCVRTFDHATVRAIASLVAAVRGGRPAAIDEAFVTLGGTVPPAAAERETYYRLLRGFFAPMSKAGAHAVEPDQAIEARRLLANKRALMNLGLPGKLLFLFRIRFGLYAVLARLGAVADWATLEEEWAEPLVGRA